MLHIMKFWILLRHIPPIVNFGYAQDSRRAADMAAPLQLSVSATVLPLPAVVT